MARLAFDSATGGTCPRCRRALSKCHCAADLGRNLAPAGDGVVRIRRELRNGKPVTVVVGLLLAADELLKKAAELKAKCGTGGTAKDGVIELQGDHRDRVVDLLQRAGHTVKLAGG
jgi:translation initiation factor 1